MRIHSREFPRDVHTSREEDHLRVRCVDSSRQKFEFSPALIGVGRKPESVRMKIGKLRVRVGVGESTRIVSSSKDRSVYAGSSTRYFYPLHWLFEVIVAFTGVT
jgi:hypothetical protein